MPKLPPRDPSAPPVDHLALSRHHRAIAIEHLEQAVKDLRQDEESDMDDHPRCLCCTSAEERRDLEQRLAALGEKVNRNALARAILADRFRDETNPYECVHTALSRAVGLAGLLNEVFDAGDMDDRVHRALTPSHLAYTAEILRHEIRAALIVFGDFWDNGGGSEAWRARQEEGAGSAAA